MRETHSMKKHIRILTMMAASAVTASLPMIVPSTQFATIAQTAPDAAKTDLYTKFYNAVVGNNNIVNEAAYEIGKEYMTKFGTETDAYTVYVRDQVKAYETALKNRALADFFASIHDPQKRNLPNAFSRGREYISASPDDLNILISLANAGYLANTENNKQFNNEATNYTKKAIQLIESGKEPVDLSPENKIDDHWYPFTNKQDTLAFLYFTLGDMSIAASPTEAARNYVKAASMESFLKKSPSLYSNLANAYLVDYTRLSKDFKTYYEGQPESDDSRAALANLNQVIDRIIDASARAVSYSGTDAKYQQLKTNAQEQLTGFYKFRNNNTDTGLPAFIASVTSKPLPEPVVVTISAPTTPAVATDGTTTTTPNGATPTASPTPTATPARPTATPTPTATPARPATTPTKPATTTRPKSRA